MGGDLFVVCVDFDGDFVWKGQCGFVYKVGLFDGYGFQDYLCQFMFQLVFDGCYIVDVVVQLCWNIGGG